ncbi:MAG: hypothetical protein ACRD96_29540 [Bryobacteraceae bacterium]
MIRPILLSLACLASLAADIGEVRTVYLMPMTGGLDQFLANRLAEAKLMQVVADPKRADAYFTDRLGEAFEKRLQDLATTEEEKAKKKDDREVRPYMSGTSRGNIFLVDSKTRQVLWSAYERPRRSAPDELDRTADRIVKRLKRELQPSK